MEKATKKAMTATESYEISVRKDDWSADFYRFFYGEAEESSDDAADLTESGLTGTEYSAFLKCVCLLFAGALATVLTLLIF